MKKKKKGDAYRTETQMEMRQGSIVISGSFGDVHGKIDRIGHSIEVTKFVAVDSEGPSVIEVFHEMDSQIVKRTIKGKIKKFEKNGPLHGKIVLKKRNGDAWSETIKGEKATPELDKFLKKDARSESTLYPDRKITIGESWTVPANTFKRLFGDDMLTLDGTMTCKLDRIENYSGQECVVILFDLQAKGTGLDYENDEIKYIVNFHGTTYRSLKFLIDLQTEVTGTVQLENVMVQDGQKLTMVVTGPINIIETNTRL